MLLFFTWWYNEELKNVLKYFETFFEYLFDLFSVRICFSTLFAVWRRDKVNYKGLPIKDIFQAWTMNMASRLVGAVVKIFTIFAYLLVAISCLVFVIVFLLAWLMFPIVILALIYLGIKNILGL